MATCICIILTVLCTRRNDNVAAVHMKMHGQTCAHTHTYTQTKTPTQSSNALICMHTNEFKFKPNNVECSLWSAGTCTSRCLSLLSCFSLFQPIHSVFMSLLSLVQRLFLSLCFSRCPMFGISTGIWLQYLCTHHLIYTATVFTWFHNFWMMNHKTR